MRQAHPLAALLIMALGGCAQSIRAGYPTADACIHDQFFSSIVTFTTGGVTARAQFARAMTACGDPVPDLTGDTMTQAVAILYGVRFKIDLAKDTQLKTSIDGQIIGTGSMIPLPPMVFKPA